MPSNLVHPEVGEIYVFAVTYRLVWIDGVHGSPGLFDDIMTSMWTLVAGTLSAVLMICTSISGVFLMMCHSISCVFDDVHLYQWCFWCCALVWKDGVHGAPGLFDDIVTSMLTFVASTLCAVWSKSRCFQ